MSSVVLRFTTDFCGRVVDVEAEVEPGHYPTCNDPGGGWKVHVIVTYQGRKIGYADAPALADFWEQLRRQALREYDNWYATASARD